MTVLIAQAEETLWPAILRTIDHNGIWIFVGFCVLAGTAKHLVSLVLRHNERIAMINAGLDPDAKTRKYPREFKDPSDRRAG